MGNNNDRRKQTKKREAACGCEEAGTTISHTRVQRKARKQLHTENRFRDTIGDSRNRKNTNNSFTITKYLPAVHPQEGESSVLWCKVQN